MTNFQLSASDSKKLAGLALVVVKLLEYEFTGTKRGVEKKAEAFDYLYNLMPDSIAAVIPRDMLDTIIEQAVTNMKRELAAKAGVSD